MPIMKADAEKSSAFRVRVRCFPVITGRTTGSSFLLVTTALTEIRALEFTVPQFQEMFETNTALSEQVVNWYAMYVNRFLFEAVHQEYNSSLVKICNLLYLLSGSPSISSESPAAPSECAVSEAGIDLTQEELAACWA